MPVEIGSLVVRGSFGASAAPKESSEDLEKRMEQFRDQLLEQVEEMIEASRRRQEDR